jgi:hypothetical protein
MGQLGKYGVSSILSSRNAGMSFIPYEHQEAGNDIAFEVAGIRILNHGRKFTQCGSKCVQIL